MDLTAHHAPLQEELHAALDGLIASNGYILGEEVDRFEQEFAAFCGVDHCIGVNSGTAALGLMLMAAGIGRGDEVIVPAHTFIASALGVVHAGATPVFCDVEDGTGLIDAEAAAAAVTERTAAVLAVHLYGQTCDMEALNALGERHGIAIFEDAAQAHGATNGGRRTGALGRAAGFSFYPSKNLGALGDGGAICTHDADLADRARQLRHLGQRGKGEHVRIGYNERLDGLQAAFLRVKLPHLERWTALRRERAAQYRELLGDSVTMLEERPYGECVYHLFPVRVSDRDEVAAQLDEAGVQTVVHYRPAVHHQPPFIEHAPSPDAFPVSAAWAAEELSLPFSPEIEPAQLEAVAGAFRALLAAR